MLRFYRRESWIHFERGWEISAESRSVRDAVRAAHFLKRICDHLFPMLPTNLRSFGTKVVIQRGCLISRFFVIVTNFYSATHFDIRDDGCGPVA